MLRGTLQLLLKVRQGGKDVMIVLPSDEEGAAQNYRFEVKNFHRLEGVFFVPNGSVPVSIEARLLQDGNRPRKAVGDALVGDRHVLNERGVPPEQY